MTRNCTTALEQRHLNEWRQSAVSDDITLRNVCTISDPTELNSTLGRSDGHRLVPGWLVTGLDPVSAQRTLVGCQFKADNPLPKLDGNRHPIPGKFNKYLGRSNESPSPLFLDTGTPDYWPQVLRNSTRELSIIEGAKKAGSLLTNDIPAVSIPGCFSWGKGGELHPLLAQFAVSGRPIILWPDSDWRENDKVAAGWYKLGQTLEALGCVVRVAIWPSEHKGIDDFAASGGDVLRVKSEAISLSEWNAQLGLDEQLEITKDDVQLYLESPSVELPLGSILPPGLAVPLGLIARSFNVPNHAILLIFLTVCASLIKGRLTISPLTRFITAPILWLGIVAESGGAKTPILRTFTSAVFALQCEYELGYQSALEVWKLAKQQDPEISPDSAPKPIDIIHGDITQEALAASLQSRPNALRFSDELASPINAQNQYRGGKGNDRQRDLELWNGGPLKASRKTGPRIFVEETSLSVLGGIQPAVLRSLVGDIQIVDGFWARFLLVSIPNTELPPPGESGGIDVYEMLLSLYRSIDRIIRQDYRLTADAQRLWDSWHREIEKLRLSEPHPALRVVYPKLREYAARLALTIHVVKYAFNGRIPPEDVGTEELESGIAICRHLLPGIHSVYYDMGAATNPEAQRIAKFIEKFAGREVTARDVQRWWPDRKHPLKAEDARRWLQTIADIGLGTKQGEGKTLRVLITENPATRRQMPCDTDGTGLVAVAESGDNPATRRQSDEGKPQICRNVAYLSPNKATAETPTAPDFEPLCRLVADFSDNPPPLTADELAILTEVLREAESPEDLEPFSRLPESHRRQIWAALAPDEQSHLWAVKGDRGNE